MKTGGIVVCTYKTKEGKEDAFQKVLREHWETLDRLGLVQPQPRLLLRGNGEKNQNEFIEVFAWKDAQAVETAHQSPEVRTMWAPMEELCESMQFPHYDPI